MGILTLRDEPVVAIGACNVVQGSVTIVIIDAVGGKGGSAGGSPKDDRDSAKSREEDGGKVHGQQFK